MRPNTFKFKKFAINFLERNEQTACGRKKTYLNNSTGRISESAYTASTLNYN